MVKLFCFSLNWKQIHFFFIFNYFQNKTKHCYYEAREDVMKYPASRGLSIFLDKSTYLGRSKGLCAQGSYGDKNKSQTGNCHSKQKKER